MVWTIVGALIAVSSGLLSLRMVRVYLMRTDPQLEAIKMTLVATGVAMTAASAIYSQAANDVLRHTLSTLHRECGDTHVTLGKTLRALEASQSTLEATQKSLQALQEKLRDRTIPHDRMGEFVSKLGAEKGERILIECMEGNEEACSFANDIRYIFLKAGWSTKGGSITIIGGPPTPGVQIFAKNDKLLQKALYITTVLDFIPFSLMPVDERLVEKLIIRVGPKSLR
jgi:hypothetical protein